MTNSQALRLSGLALAIGAGVFVLHIVLRSVITAGPDPATAARGGAWLLVNALGLLGAVLVLLGVPALYVTVVEGGEAAALVGVALTSVAWIFMGVFLSLYGLLIMPWLADRAPQLLATSAPPPGAFIVAFLAAFAAWCAGTFILAIPFTRRVEPHWLGYILPVSGVWLVVGNLILAPSGPAAHLALNLLSNLGPVLLLVPLGYVGARVWSESAPGSEGAPPRDTVSSA